MKSLAILASGSGSNAENIIRYFSHSEFIKVAVVLSNNAGAGVHSRAKVLGIPSLTFSREEFAAGDVILETLKAYQVDFVVLACMFIVRCLPRAILSLVLPYII